MSQPRLDDGTALRRRGPHDTDVARFFVVTGVFGSLGGVASPQIVGNGTDPGPSFAQAAVLATTAILAFVTAWPRLTLGARAVVALPMLFDLRILVECAPHVGTLFPPR